MTNFAEKYEGNYQGSLDSIPEVTQELKDRRNELKEKIRDNRILLITTNYEKLIRIGSFLRAANIMKKAVEKDNIDDINQNRKALQCMDIVVGMLKEEELTLNSYLKGDF